MSEYFPHLFSPIRVGTYTLKNRIMNSGHAAHFQSGDGTPSEHYAHYIRERAKGGAGIIVAGHTVPVYDGELSLSLTNYSDKSNPAFLRMADAAHEFDVPILAQLGHRGRRVMDNAAFHGRDIVAPSAVPTPDMSVPMIMPHVLTTSEAEALVESFGAAARRIRQCEFDGVELAVGMDYLIPNFLHPNGNRRTDKYGGEDLDERMTFLREVLDAMRSELGSDRLLGVRMYDDLADWSMQLGDYVELAKRLEQDGVIDYLNMWHAVTSIPRQGRMHWPSYYYEPGAFVGLSAAIKSAVTLPVVGSGRMDSPAVAELALADGKADIVGMAKTLIADPHFPNKAKEGRTEDIRTCIACTQACVGHVTIGLGVSCIYNPVSGREAELSELPMAATPRKVLVIGGGPAGMEAARVAAMRGHAVTLMERDARLGGQVKLAMRTPKRDSFEEIILWFERQLPKLGVDVRLRVDVTVEAALAAGADDIIVATGSTAFMPDVIGADRANVFSAREVLAGTADIGANLMVVDTVGRAEAITTAEYLSDRGHRVELVTGLEMIAPEMPPPTRNHLLEKLMGRHNVTLTTHTGVWEIGDGVVEVFNVVTWEPDTRHGVDTVVFGSGGLADDSLFHQLRQAHPSVRAVGDCYQPRDIELSVLHGHRAAREI
jgi:2,4-dienoyl-CoA reductase-like NADH-dependent reductase (Old Yellow Enzyme family)/thioredoxin reductase